MAAAFLMTGTVKDIDGSTSLNGARVVILDVTSNEKISGTTNALGQFSLNLANLTSGYTNGDHLQISASYGTSGSSSIRTVSERYVLVVSDGNHSSGNMICHEGEEPFNSCFITFAGVANADNNPHYVDFYDRKNDQLVFRIYIPKNDSKSFPIGFLGQKMDGGFLRVFSDTTTGDLIASVVFK